MEVFTAWIFSLQAGFQYLRGASKCSLNLTVVCLHMCVCMRLRLYCLGQSRNCRWGIHSVVTNKEPNLIPHAVINKLMQFYTGMGRFYRTLLSSAGVRESGSHFKIKNIQPYASGERRRSEESFAYMWVCLILSMSAGSLFAHLPNPH